MNRRKLAYLQGLSELRKKTANKLSRNSRTICAIRPSLYNRAGMISPNQIIQGDSIELLNAGPEGWVDLCFADPPFNIGYLYHNYDDEKDVDEYVDWSEKWMRAVHRALKPTGADPLTTPISNPPTQAQVTELLYKINELIAALSHRPAALKPGALRSLAGVHLGDEELYAAIPNWLIQPSGSGQTGRLITATEQPK